MNDYNRVMNKTSAKVISKNENELCGSEVANMISSFEESNDKPVNVKLYKKHHEDTPSFRNRFVEDVQKLSQKFLVNPFESDDFTAVHNSMIMFDEPIIKSIKSISMIGENQFEEFWNKRLVRAEIAVSEEIKKNNLRLPRHMMDGKSCEEKEPTLIAKMV